MKTLHDPAVRASLEARLETLGPTAERRWGTLTVDQMLWHVNFFLDASLGEGPVQDGKPPMPLWLMRLLLLYAPWPKSAPTNPGAVAKERHDFEGERRRCKELIARFVALPVDGPWPVDPTFGDSGGRFATRLQARHLDHHFRQFGA